MGVEIIPSDDILMAYGPANDQKKRAVSHILDPKCGTFLAVVESGTEGGERTFWIVGEVSPLDTAPLAGMVIDKYHGIYGDTWLRALLLGLLRTKPKALAMETLEYLTKLLEEDSGKQGS